MAEALRAKAGFPLTERQFMDQVTEYATLRGWDWYHARPARTLDSWRTAGSGTMAKGWPDLVLVRPPRLIFAELKRDGGTLSADQARVMGVLGAFMAEAPEIPEDFPIPKQRSYLDGVFAGLDKALHDGPKVEVVVWRPVDWTRIEKVLA
jgi:hypothetical protein